MPDWGSIVDGDFTSDGVTGLAVSKFLKAQDPENISFKRYKNGYAIEVKADEETVEDAQDFWENNVEPKL